MDLLWQPGLMELVANIEHRALYNCTHASVFALVQQQVNWTKLWLSYTVWDGLGWLAALQVDLQQPMPLCIKYHNGTINETAQLMGWTPGDLCQHITILRAEDTWGKQCFPLKRGSPYSIGIPLDLQMLRVALLALRLDWTLYLGEAVHLGLCDRHPPGNPPESGRFLSPPLSQMRRLVVLPFCHICTLR